MNAEFEPLSGIIRVFKDNEKYGDSYTWIVTCRFINKETVELMGAIKAPTLNEFKAVKNMLKQKGIKIILYKRYKNNQVVQKKINVI